MKLQDVINTRYAYVAAMFLTLFLSLFGVPVITAAALAVMVIASIVYWAIQFRFWRCPVCGKYLGRDVPHHCPHCGEHLDI